MRSGSSPRSSREPTSDPCADARVRGTREGGPGAGGGVNGAEHPSASDIERLTRRVRSVSQRLEGIEDRVDGRVAALNANAGVEGRLSAIEEQLGAISRELAAIHQALAGTAPRVPRNAERLMVGEE